MKVHWLKGKTNIGNGCERRTAGWTILLVSILLVCFLRNSEAEVLFSENYDLLTGWNCSKGVPNPWTSQATCSYWTYNGVSHYDGEIGPGGIAGNSLKLWRHNGGTTVYAGYLGKTLTQAEFNRRHKEVFTRFYMKIPREWDAVLGPGATHKISRFHTARTYGGQNTSEIFFDVKGGTFKGGRFTIYCLKEGAVRYSSKTVSELGIADGAWHCYEIHFKMNSASNVSDGELHFYIDGVQVEIYTPYGPIHPQGLSKWNFGYAADEYISTFMPPAIGNLPPPEGAWKFPTNDWYAIEFDNYVVSTSYVGPGGSVPSPSPTPPPVSDVTPPSPPGGLKTLP